MLNLVRHRRRTAGILLAVLSGAILALAMPRPGVWALAWVGMVPLLAALRGLNTAPAALCGLACGLVYFGIILFWVSLFGWLPWALLVIVEAAFFAAFAAVAARVLPARIGWWGYVAVPAAWTAIQWVRSLGTYSLTWGSFAHTQASNLPVAQLASITGPWGIDFLVCLANLALAGAMVPYAGKRRLAPAGVAAGLTAAVFVYGLVVMRSPISGPAVKVAVVQESLVKGLQDAMTPDPDFPRHAYREYMIRSLEAVGNHKPDLIVWPETALGDAITPWNWGPSMSRLARLTRTSILVGGYDLPSPVSANGYNSVQMYDSTGRRTGTYRKVRLVPFGEFVPLRALLPLLEDYGVRDDDILPGKRHVLLDANLGPSARPLQIGVSVCFESLFPHISQTETLEGAEALFVLTNDSWFDRTPAARQHMMMSTLRAIENRRYVVRSATTGISAIIDPYGRTLGELGIYRPGVLAGEIRPMRALTPYTRLGQYFAYLCAAIALASVALTWKRGGLR